MSFLIVLAALIFLMVAAYRGMSVILFAPIAAMGAVLLTDPAAVAPVFTNLFMDSMATFVKKFFPVFLLGAIFGKLVEISGFARAIVASAVGLLGHERAMLAIVLVAALMTYGGVSLFVVVFAVYPFASELFRLSNIPKRLIPATIALGAFTFTMDALPGTPQIQNIIPTTFFKTDAWAAPVLGFAGALFVLASGLVYLNIRRRSALAAGEGYGEGHTNEPQVAPTRSAVRPIVAILPLVVVGVASKLLTIAIPAVYGSSFETTLTSGGKPVVADVAALTAIWAVQGALVLGILTVLVFAWRPVVAGFADGARSAVSGALLAAMSDQFVAAANSAGIPMEVLHRVASMASGGMDTLPHNGAVITLLAVTGLTHRQSYGDIFAITCIKTVAVFVVIAVYYMTGWV